MMDAVEDGTTKKRKNRAKTSSTQKQKTRRKNEETEDNATSPVDQTESSSSAPRRYLLARKAPDCSSVMTPIEETPEEKDVVVKQEPKSPVITDADAPTETLENDNGTTEMPLVDSHQEDEHLPDLDLAPTSPCKNGSPPEPEQDGMLDLFEYMRGNQNATVKAHTGNGSMVGLLDCISGRKDAPKLFFCHDHDTRDMFGACTFVVAQDESRALEYLDKRLIAKGFQSCSQHQFTVKRLPVYRECCFFIGSMVSKKLDEQIAKEDALMLERIRPKDMEQLKVYYAFSSAHSVRSGYIIISRSKKDALYFLESNMASTSSNDRVGLFGSPGMPGEVQALDLHEMQMKNGTIVSMTL